MNTLLYRLQRSDNPLEKDTYLKIENKFPNFIELENKFLFQLKDDTLNWRDDTLIYLEEIGMCQWGVLKSLNFINKSKPFLIAGDSDQRFKNIYFHFGLIFDTVENMARNIALTEDYLHILDIRKQINLSKNKLISDFQKYVENKYPSDFENMLLYGKPIFHYPQQQKSFMKIIVKNKNLRKRYSKFVELVKKYRNFFIHNAGVDIVIIPSTGQQFALKKEFIQNPKYRHWSLIKKSIEDKINMDHFNDPLLISDSDFEKTLSFLNEFWKYFINELKAIYAHPDFAKISKGFNRENQIKTL